MHVRRLEAGGVVAADQQTFERTEFEASAPGLGVVDFGDVVVLVVTAGEADVEHAEHRNADFAAGCIFRTLAAAAGAGEVVDLADAREDARIGFQVVGLTAGFQRGREAHRAGRQLEQIAAEYEAGRRVLGLAVILDNRRHRRIVGFRDRAVEAIEVEVVDRQAVRDTGQARVWTGAGGAEARTHEVVGRTGDGHARALALGVVLGAADGPIPVETVGDGAAQAERQIQRVLVELLEGALAAAVGFRGQRADREDAHAELRVVEARAGLRTALPLFHAAAEATAGIEGHDAGPAFQVVGEVVRAVDIGRQIIVAVLHGLVCHEAVVAAAWAQKVTRGAAGVGVRTIEFAAAAIAAGRLHITDRATRRAQSADLDADRRLVTTDAGGAVDAGRRRVVAGRIHEVALVAEQRFRIVGLECVGDAPVVAGLAADPLQIADVAAALGAGLALDLEQVAFVVGLQHDVDHARDRVGAVDRRGAAGQDFDALHRCGRDAVEVLEVAAAVVRERIVVRAATVDQQQGAARAETAQVDHAGVRREAAGGVEVVLGEAGVGTDGFQRVVHGVEAFALDLLGGDDGDGRRAFDLGALDAAADDFDSVECPGLLGG